VFVYACLSVYVRVPVYLYLFVCVCVYIRWEHALWHFLAGCCCVFVYVCLSVCVCVHVYLYLYMCVCVYTLGTSALARLVTLLMCFSTCKINVCVYMSKSKSSIYLYLCMGLRWEDPVWYFMVL